MQIINNLEQGTKEWLDIRRAKITGTRLGDVMGTDYGKLKLICELIAEEATEQTKIVKVTSEMERGSNEEVFARKLFTQMTKQEITEIGFCISDKYDYLGCSGDGWIKTKKGFTKAIEIKCPNSENSVFYKLGSMFSNEDLELGSWSAVTEKKPESVFKPNSNAFYKGIPADYKYQVANYFIVNEILEELHFVTFDSRFVSDELKLSYVTVTREDMQPIIDEIIPELEAFRVKWLKYRNLIIKDNF